MKKSRSDKAEEIAIVHVNELSQWELFRLVGLKMYIYARIIAFRLWIHEKKQ